MARAKTPKGRRIPFTAGGGRNARPLGAAVRIALALLAAGMLALALRQTLQPGGGIPSVPVSDFPGSASAAVSDEGNRAIDWAALPEAVVAWVEVPGASIDEPIAQATADAPNRYLHADALGRGAYGTPYLDWECSPDSPFSIVYGHHMDDGSVFADFARFSDRGYAEGHRSIRVRIRADDRVCELRVVAVDVVDADEERVRASFGSDGERVAYLNERISSSDLVLEEADLSDSKVWAFATCSYQTPNSRTVVYAIEDRR
ncbi:MAG: class B sortase [Eggerthellaceae bacterium]|nr:class B sortase [Eggerthellaceae bacterium]